MTESTHTVHMQSLMHLCVDRATCVESINLISTPLPSKCNIRSVWLDCSSHREWKGPALASQVFSAFTPTCSLDLQLPLLPECRRISLRWLPLCFSTYCSTSLHNADLSALIYQAPSCHYSQSTRSRDTVVTGPGRGEAGGRGALRRKWWTLLLSWDAYRLSMRFSTCIRTFNVTFCCLRVLGRHFSSRRGFSCMNGWRALQRTCNHKPCAHICRHPGFLVLSQILHAWLTLEHRT